MLFCAEITDYKMVYNILKAISFKEYAVLRPMEEGLKVTLDELKCIETSAYIPCNMFSYYHVDTSEEIMFKVNLKIVTECLNIFGDDGNPSLKLSYSSVGSPLCLVIKHAEENITLDIEVRTMNVDEFTDLCLAGECNTNKIVINASILLELLQRLDNSADDMKLLLSPDPPYFKLSTTGIGGESEVNISKNSESVTIFQCTSTLNAQYLFQYVRHVLKGMTYASKVAISTGGNGLLGLQLVINADDKQMFIEYYITPQYNEE